MGIGNLNASDIVAFAAREGNKMISAQVNMKARLFAALDKTPMKGRRAVINVVNGGLSSTAQVVDFGALPTEAASVPAQGFVDAVGYVSRLGLGRIALETLSGVDDSADLLDLQLQIAADDMARQIGRSVFGSELAAPTVAGSAVTQVGGGLTAVTMTVVITGGLSDFREGEAYAFESSLAAGNTQTYLVLCTNVAITSDNVVTVTFICGPGGVPGYTAPALADALLVACGGVVVAAPGPSTAGVIRILDRFFLRGQRNEPPAGSTTGVPAAGRGASNTGIVDLSVVTSQSATLHGLPAGANGWTGLSFTATSPTAELFLAKSKIVQARSGVAPTHLVLGTLASGAYGAAQITNGTGFALGAAVLTQPRRNVDGKLDKYGKDGDMESGLAMFGRPVLIDDNCPTGSAFMINKDYLKIGEWKKLSAEDEGGSPLLLSRSTYSKEVQFSCIYNMICRKRNAHASITGLVVA
jgi:hypothetical protein